MKNKGEDVRQEVQIRQLSWAEETAVTERRSRSCRLHEAPTSSDL